jgi:hypothetical protein
MAEKKKKEESDTAKQHAANSTLADMYSNRSQSTDLMTVDMNFPADEDVFRKTYVGSMTNSHLAEKTWPSVKHLCGQTRKGVTLTVIAVLAIADYYKILEASNMDEKALRVIKWTEPMHIREIEQALIECAAVGNKQ